MAIMLLAPWAPRPSWVILVVFTNLVLVGERLMFTTRYVSRKNISKLSLSRVLHLFFVAQFL